METKDKKYSNEEIRGFFVKKKVTAVMFIISMMYLFISTFYVNSNEETSVNFYGYLQNILCKKEEADFEVLKDNEGLLHLTSFLEEANDVSEPINSMVNLKENIENSKTKLIYLMTPDKVIENYTKFERGLPEDFNNETADNFLSGLKENSLEYIDFRDDILNNGIEKRELFYKTDHHWKIETAFQAFVYLIDELNSGYNEELDISGELRNLDSYNLIKYEDAYLGSLGRKTGRYYAGLDDFMLIYPKYNTSFDLYLKTNDVEINTAGKFEEALLSISTLRNKDLFSAEGDKYSTYLFGNQGFLHIKNNLMGNGIKVLFIKDSLAVPLAAFLSNTVSDIYMIDPRFYKDDIVEAVNSYEDLDYVFVSFSPQNLTREFFRF